MVERQVTRADGPTTIYRDAALRALLVVQHGGALWLVPRKRDGWSNRSKVTMTDAAKAERVRPTRNITAAWLGIGAQADLQPWDFDGHEQNRADVPQTANLAQRSPDVPWE